jgi:hypothetical protein
MEKFWTIFGIFLGLASLAASLLGYLDKLIKFLKEVINTNNAFSGSKSPTGNNNPDKPLTWEDIKEQEEKEKPIVTPLPEVSSNRPHLELLSDGIDFNNVKKTISCKLKNINPESEVQSIECQLNEMIIGFDYQISKTANNTQLIELLFSIKPKEGHGFYPLLNYQTSEKRIYQQSMMIHLNDDIPAIKLEERIMHINRDKIES